MQFESMSVIKYCCVFESIIMSLTTLCSFWKNRSGHFERFACNHSYGYVFRRIIQTDSLRFPQNSAFL